jgi:hypothetical protein
VLLLHDSCNQLITQQRLLNSTVYNFMAFQTDIRSTEQYNHEVLGIPGTLQVLECYNEWAGPCKPIQSTLKALYFSLSDRPLKFYTVRVLTIRYWEQQWHQGQRVPAAAALLPAACLACVFSEPQLQHTPPFMSVVTSLHLHTMPRPGHGSRLRHQYWCYTVS